MMSAAKMPSAMNSGVRPMSSCSAPRRELVAMSYSGTDVREVPHSSAMAATAAAESHDSGESQSAPAPPGSWGRVGSPASL